MTQEIFGLSNEMFDSYQKVDIYKFKAGEHRWRFLPPYKPNQLFSQIPIHWGYQDTDDKTFPVRCLASTKKGWTDCPICCEHQRMITEAAGLKSTGKEEDVKKAEVIEKRAGEIRRVATFNWQVLDDSGSHKVLSLTYNPNEGLKKKIGYWWKVKKVNVTDPERNYIIYCNKTGKGSQTNYQYEVEESNIRKIEVPKLYDLDNIYEPVEYEVLKQIVETGFLPTKKAGGEADNSSPTHMNSEASQSPVSSSSDSAEQISLDTGFTADDIPF